LDVDQAKTAHTNELMQAPGVVGVAVGREGAADVILLLVETLTPDNDTPEKLGLPPVLDGYPLVIREVGRLEAHNQ
jgi:hypothetical protein